MRGVKSTIVLLVVLGGLLAYIFWDARRERADPDARPGAFDISAESIEELTIRAGGGETSRLTRAGDGWQLVEPVAADADTGVVGTVTSNLATLEVQRVVDEEPSDLSQYGLESPPVEIGFRLRDQQEFQRLLVGEKTPTGGDVYAMRADEKRVFLISSYLESIFNRTPFDLRDKALLKFERDRAEAVEIVGGSRTLRLTRDGVEWRIASPIAARADYASAEAILTRLTATHMQAIVSETGEDLPRFGLDRPFLTATVLAGSSRATLLLGRMADDGGFYAKDAARPAIFTVEQALAADLERDAWELRRKDLFDGRSFNATRVEIRRNGETRIFEKTETDGVDTWRDASGRTVEVARIDEAILRLSNLRAESFVPGRHSSLDAPVLAATIHFDEGKMETVTFAREGDEVFASRQDEPGAARVETSLFEDAIQAVDALK